MRLFLAMLLSLFPGVLLGANMWAAHGHNYTLPSSGGEGTIFPVVWDIRSANSLLSDWHRIYGPGELNPIYGILQEASESGINTVMIRSELGDKWFPELPGTYGDKFFPLAGAAREIGLHVIPGGIETAFGQDEHNQAVMDYLKLYIPMTEGAYPGEVIGFFAFDEPDVKYLENPGLQQEWTDLVSFWSQQSRTELGLPVISYFAKFGNQDDTGYMQYYTDTTSVLNRLARFTDAVGMGMYPATSNFRRTDLLDSDMSAPLFTCATDLLQNDPLYIDAMAGKDEVIRIYPSGDSALVLIEEVAWDGFDLHLVPCMETGIPIRPDNLAASDYRSGYAVHESQDYVNSGVVLWDSSRPVHEAVLISSMNGLPVVGSIPRFEGSEDMRPFFFAVGQSDYWADVSDVQGIIGRGRLTVLAGLEDSDGERWLMLFVHGRPGVSSGLQIAFNEPRRLYFPASGAVWGTFWGTWYEFGTVQPVARNGFIIYDHDGNYVSLSQLGRNYWQVFPSYGVSQYQQLFGSSGMPDFLRVSRNDGNYPPFFTGYDRLVGYFSDQSRIVTASSHIYGGSMTEIDSMDVTGLTGPVTGFDLYRNDYRYWDRPLFTTEDRGVHAGRGSIDTGMETGVMDTEPVRYCQGDTIITGIRVMHTRDVIRSALVASEEGFYVPECELYDDKFDDWRYQWYPNAHRTGMELGIQETSRDNALFAVVQSFGRHGFALPSYCPSPDTLLYMVTAPVVEGARGIVFYALDLAMMSGNGGNDGYSRAPFVLQNWGPSRDTGNTDLITGIHETTAILTGRLQHGTDYLGALVSPDWRVLGPDRARNVNTADSLLNFIALENAQSDTVILLAVNNSTGESPFSPGIELLDLPAGFSVTEAHGFIPGMFNIELNPDGTTLTELDFSPMPPLTASLITLTAVEDGSCQGTYLETSTSSQGNTLLVFSLCETQSGELSLYDMAGRRVSTLWQGNGTGNRVNALIRKNEQAAGLYFAVLRSETGIITGKCLLW